MNELGFYTLAGKAESPVELLDEVREGEAMGFGSVFISERFNVKEAVTLSGAAGGGLERDGHRDRRHQPEHAPSRSSPRRTR